MVFLYRNTKSSDRLHKQVKYGENLNNSPYSLSSSRYACWKKFFLVYHNGYHIPKLWPYVNHGSSLAIKSSHYGDRATYDDRYNEKNQQMSLNSRKRMQCLLEVPKYHGYHIPKLWAYVNHGTESSHYISKRTTVRKINNVLYFLTSLRHACCKKCLWYHNGYYIPKLWACVNHGSFLAILNQVTTA